MTVRETFASRLKYLREKAGLNQEQFADKLNISRGSVSYYENEQRVPDIEILVKIADYFGVTTEYLLGRSPNKTFENDYIGKKLGLSDDAIGTLEMNNQSGNYPFIETVNHLLELESFYQTGIPYEDVEEDVILYNKVWLNGKVYSPAPSKNRLLSTISNYFHTKLIDVNIHIMQNGVILTPETNNNIFWGGALDSILMSAGITQKQIVQAAIFNEMEERAANARSCFDKKGAGENG